ncbi:D-2-hydroxyacid dehydrogenase [Bacillus sp. DJP31]|uniref:D-2-hydroxyacid dehydrogenase n=1 Tax=Bacillus sp. DJP31 TaxID=3409789 RepID=UPI003BB65B5F
MKIITSFPVKEEKQTELKSYFLDEEFFFFQNIHEAADELENAEVLLTYGEDLTPALIEQATSLKWIMVMSAGMEKMPFQAINEKNILVTNARGIHKIPMSEYALGMMLQVSKQMKLLYEQEIESNWNRAIPTTELYGKTILIIGVGAIGGQIAMLCKSFGMSVLGISRSGNPIKHVEKIGKLDTLEHLLPKADYIVSVLPSTNETRYILKRKHFEKMKSNSIFMNIGRGDLVEESVLIDVMSERLIAHAVLDVFEQEPLPSEHLFWKMDNVTVTPHISSITANYLPRAFEIFEENLHIYRSKRTDYVNLINVKRGY